MKQKAPLNLTLLAVIFSVLSSAPLFAEDLQPAVDLPSGEKIVSGDVTVDRSIANNLNVNIASQNAIVEWANFSVGAGFAVNFNFNIAQPSLGSILNSVTGSAMSVINGAINSNGSVFLANPNGIVFGQTAAVNTASFLASTLKMDYDSFLNPVNGQYKFLKGDVNGFIKNAGRIAAKPGGYIALLSQAVENSGTLAVSSIDAKVGRIVLASGEKMTVAMDDRSLISVAIDEGVKEEIFGPDGTKMDSAIKNSGSILADGGKVTLTAKTLNKVFDYAINNTGIIQANNLVKHDGVIELVAEGAPILNTGTIAAGTVTVTVKDAGFINIGKVSTNGTPELPNAGTITINALTILQQGTISADALEGGNAGEVSLVSESSTKADDHSTTSAKAVGVVGNGGRVLLDSKNGNTRVSALAIIDVSAGSESGNAGSVEVGAFDQLGFFGVLNGRAPPGGNVATVKFVYHSSSVPPVIIVTDQADYSPSGTPIISGSGFLPGQAVTLNIFAPDGTQEIVTATADADGSFAATYTPAVSLMYGQYYATGSDGVRSAVVMFTDAGVAITAATGGTGISADNAADASSPAWTTLTDIVIAESNKKDFNKETTNVTLVLTAPAGWTFNAGIGTVSHITGKDISSSSISVTSSTVTVTLTVGSESSSGDAITIHGIQVQALQGAALPSSGNILSSGTATINGITNGSTNFGSLSQVAGAAQYFTLNAPANITAGGARAAYVVTRYDQFNNLVTSGSQVVSLSQSAAGGNDKFYNAVSSGSAITQVTIPNSSSSANFWLYAELANTRTITVSATGITSATDNITVNPGTASKLVFTTSPSGVTYGSAFSAVVQTQDQFGNNSVNGLANDKNVTITLTTGLGTLSGTTTLNIGKHGGNGTANFTGLTISAANDGDVLTASATGLTSGTTTFDVSKASLTVTADNQGKVYGDTDPTLTYTPSGTLYYGDAYSVITGVS
ncbi:MAG: filamentous hemagglutinin N-terminal domain-containing protein, partial [Candidatus Omnitrophota bacterium]